MLLFSRHSGRALQRTLRATLCLRVDVREHLSFIASKQHLLTAQHDGFGYSAGAEGLAAIGRLRHYSQAASGTSTTSPSYVVAQGDHGNPPANAAHLAEGGQQLQPDAGSEALEVFVDSEAESRQHHVRFVDRLRVDIAAGHGGRGCVSFVKSATRGTHKQHSQCLNTGISLQRRLCSRRHCCARAVHCL